MDKSRSLSDRSYSRVASSLNYIGHVGSSIAWLRVFLSYNQWFRCIFVNSNDNVYLFIVKGCCRPSFASGRCGFLVWDSRSFFFTRCHCFFMLWRQISRCGFCLSDDHRMPIVIIASWRLSVWMSSYWLKSFRGLLSIVDCYFYIEYICGFQAVSCCRQSIIFVGCFRLYVLDCFEDTFGLFFVNNLIENDLFGG